MGCHLWLSWRPPIEEAPVKASGPNAASPRYQGRRRRAVRVALVAVALIASTILPLPAGGADGYSDVSSGDTHEPAISALAEMGVFDDTDCGEGLFCPGDPVERWVMAVWLIRVLGGDLPAAGTSRFADVEASEWWSPHAEELANRNITAGCATGPLRYCPTKPVTRGQMATFFVRAFDLPDAPAAGFTDTAGTTHEARIDALAAAGVTKGCKTDPLRFCPTKAVTRSQMATFLHRALLAQKEQMGSETTELSDDVPDADLIDLSSGDTVNLRSVFDGDKAVMFWFWAEW